MNNILLTYLIGGAIGLVFLAIGWQLGSVEMNYVNPTVEVYNNCFAENLRHIYGTTEASSTPEQRSDAFRNCNPILGFKDFDDDNGTTTSMLNARYEEKISELEHELSLRLEVINSANNTLSSVLEDLSNNEIK